MTDKINHALENLENLSLEDLLKKLSQLENDAKFLDALFNSFLITLIKDVNDHIQLSNQETGEVYILTKVRGKRY